MSKTILIVNATPNPNEAESLAYYTEHAGAILKAHHGKLIGKYSISQTITQNILEQNVMIMEFEDTKIIEALNTSEAYQKLISHRDKAFKNISISFATKHS